MKINVLIYSISLVLVLNACGSKCFVDNDKDVGNKYQFITSNNLDYMTSDSYDNAISALYEAKLDHYAEYLKEKFSDKYKYCYNYTKEGKFRFLDNYYKTYIPSFCVSDIWKSIASEPGFEDSNLFKKIEMALHSHEVYGLLGVACIDLDNDDKMEMIVIESRYNNYEDSCKFIYCFNVLSYDGEIHESNTVFIDPHYIPETSFEYILAVKKINNEAYLYWYKEIYNDFDGDSYGRGFSVYCFKNDNIEKAGGLSLDEDTSEYSDEGYAERKSFIDKYYPQNMSIKSSFDFAKLCIISNKKMYNDLDFYETINYVFNIRVFFTIIKFNKLYSTP